MKYFLILVLSSCFIDKYDVFFKFDETKDTITAYMKNSQNKITRKYDDYILVLKSGSSEQKKAIKSGEAVFTLNKFITQEKIIFNYYIENYGDIKGKIEEHLTISYDLSYDTTKCDDLDQKECKAILDFANYANYKIKENKICELNNIICYPLGDKKTIVSVDWNSSDLDGVIHKSIGQLVNLNYLDLSNNKLRKKIPKTINSLTNLRLLLLNNNKLSGKIPDLRNLKYLSYLIINSNQFEGEIPNWISELINLKIIAFSNNKFSGNIPNIKKLVNLKYIFFNQNQFEGPIFGLSSLNNLEAIGIDMEQLDVNIGSIPNLGEKDFFLKVYTRDTKCSCNKDEYCLLWDSSKKGPIINFELDEILKNEKHCTRRYENYKGIIKS